MDKKMFQVTFEGRQKEFPEGTTYREVLAAFSYESELPVVLVRDNNRLREIFSRVRSDCEIRPVPADDPNGFRTVRRSMVLVLLAALKHIAGEKAVGETMLHQSMANGFYFEIGDAVPVTDALLEELKAEMQAIISRKSLIWKRSMPVWEARKMFRERKMYDKDRLLRYRTASQVNIYELEGFSDYFYGYMVPDTGYALPFDLAAYDKGLMLLLPDRADLTRLPEFAPSPKLFDTQIDTAMWGRRLGIENAADLNDAICQGGLEDTILYAEAMHEGRLSDIAGEIAKRETVKFVLIAGPSSSGKTTFSRRLSVQLKAHGLQPHPISLDNYYVNRVDTPLDENGDYDFECLEAIDLELFNKDMKTLLDGGEVELPYYNFKTGCREYNGEFLKLKEGDILVLEGIHCLNDRMTEMLPDESKFRIYISALTQLNLDNHNRIPTTDGRLLRRMVRDYRTRGTSAQNTIARWNSVRKGEEKNIFPFQEKADATFNSALIYELAVLKTSVMPLLFQIPEDSPEHEEAKRMLKFLDYFLTIPSEAIPNNSILREFVGGGCFKL